MGQSAAASAAVERATVVVNLYKAQTQKTPSPRSGLG